MEIGKPDGAETYDDDLTDPEIAKLNAAVKDLSSKVDHSQHTQQQASHNSFEQTWGAWALAKDDQGKELHPGAANMRALMGTYLEANPEQPGETLQDAFTRAYDAVKYVDPELREQTIKSEADAKAKEAAAAAEKQRKADLDKAKKAGRTVKSKSATVKPAPDTADTWKDGLEQAWDAAEEEAA